jgi:aspartyl aminopeptidase
MSSLGADLRAFIDASPSPFHAVAEMVRRLSGGGFTELSEQERWTLAPGDQRYVIRDGGSLVAFRVGTQPLADAGLMGIGTHTDSPTFKVRPQHDLNRFGYRLVGVEPYGGILAHTWMDRELTIAGRVTLPSGVTELVKLEKTTLRLPSLAIHLDGSVREGLTLDPQRQLVPLLGLESAPALLEQLGATAALVASVA